MRTRILHVLIVVLVSFQYAAGFVPDARAALNDPDLIVDSITVTPALPAVGQPVTIVATVKYEGVTPKTTVKGLSSYKITLPGFVHDAFFTPTRDTSPSIDEPLESGGLIQYTFKGSFSGGGHTALTFLIDEEDGVLEKNESNNDLTIPLAITGQFEGSDLAMQWMNVSPAVPKVGEEAVVTVTAVYTGTYPLSAGQGMGVLQELGGFVPSGSGDTSPSPSVGDPLMSGETITYTWHGHFDSAGVQTLSVDIDSANELWESNEDNNSAEIFVTVQPAEETSDTGESDEEAETGDESTDDDQGSDTGDDTSSDEGYSPEERDIRERIRRQGIVVSQREREVVAMERNLSTTVDSALVSRLRGYILLQVESVGEAWYLESTVDQRFYLENGNSAYDALEAFGLGIANADLAKIPVAGSGSSGDAGLVDRMRGKILLQVESVGEAWYVHPATGERHYMPDGDAAYQIMRNLSLGITDENLRKIPVGTLEL